VTTNGRPDNKRTVIPLCSFTVHGPFHVNSGDFHYHVWGCSQCSATPAYSYHLLLSDMRCIYENAADIFDCLLPFYDLLLFRHEARY
jgi:hypothetical protein